MKGQCFKRISIILILVLMTIMLSGCNILGLDTLFEDNDDNKQLSDLDNKDNVTDLTSKNNNSDKNDEDDEDANINNEEEDKEVVDNEQNNSDREEVNNTNDNKENDIKDTIPEDSELYVEPKDETTSLVVYYQDEHGYVIPITIKVKKTYQVATASFEAMVKSDITKAYTKQYGLEPIIPSGTTIRSIFIENQVATIDLSGEVLDYESKIEEYNIFTSIIYMLTGFSTVDEVKILIDGSTKTNLKFGADISGKLKRSDVMINANDFKTPSDKVKYDIYFVKPISNQELLVPLSASFYESSKSQVPEKMIGMLTKNYEEYHLYTQIPKDTKIVQTKLTKDTIEIVFTDSIKNYQAGSAAEIALLNQLLYSFHEIDTMLDIKLSIDGQEDILTHGTLLDEAFSVSKYINRVQ